MVDDGITSDELDEDPEPSIFGLQTSPTRETVIVEGEIDIESAPRLRDQITAALEQSIDEVVVDLREVRFIDSTGLGVLVSARQRARTLGIRLEMVLPEGQARFPFEVTGLASVFDTHRTDEDNSDSDGRA